MGRAKHQHFLLNACYGGLFGLRGQILRVDPRAPGYLDQVTRRAAREFITAGGRDQQALDGGPGGLSFFTYHLLEALGNKQLGDLDVDGAITFPELVGYLMPRATNSYQTPLAGALPGHGGGEFVFVSGQAGARPPSSAPETHIAGNAAGSVPASSAPPRTESPPDALGRWLSQHPWEIFSAIGTAAALGLLGWLSARRRRAKTRALALGAGSPPEPREPSDISQVAIGHDDVQAAANTASQNVEHHTGDRSVHIGGNATGNVIVTGDSNTVGNRGTGRRG
jgi:hypothetical protein